VEHLQHKKFLIDKWIIDAQLKLCPLKERITEPFVLILNIGQSGTWIFYPVCIIKADNKKVEINSQPATCANCNIFTKPADIKYFFGWSVRSSFQKPDIAHISEECAIDFKAKRLA